MPTHSGHDVSYFFRFLAVVILLTTLTTWSTQSVSACSCAPREPAEMLESSDAAFIGRVVSRVNPAQKEIMSSADLVTYTFEVESVAKGNLYESVNVLSAISSISCGFGDVAQVGRRMAITMYLNDDHSYQSGYCSTMAPAEMASAGVMTKPLRSGLPNPGVLNTPVPVPDDPPAVPADDLSQAGSGSAVSRWYLWVGAGLLATALFIGYRTAGRRRNAPTI